jgi:hypothetical protein
MSVQVSNSTHPPPCPLPLYLREGGGSISLNGALPPTLQAGISKGRSPIDPRRDKTSPPLLREERGLGGEVDQAFSPRVGVQAAGHLARAARAVPIAAAASQARAARPRAAVVRVVVAAAAVAAPAAVTTWAAVAVCIHSRRPRQTGAKTRPRYPVLAARRRESPRQGSRTPSESDAAPCPASHLRPNTLRPSAPLTEFSRQSRPHPRLRSGRRGARQHHVAPARREGFRPHLCSW